MRRLKSTFFMLVAAVIMIGVLWFVQRLVEPKYDAGIVEGNLTAAYYQETTKHDVLFIGDCEVYETFSPITLWREYGITSYIRGNAQQLMWHSYAMLEDALRTEKPQVVVLGVIGMQYDEPQKESYNRMALDGLRWSKTKVDAIRASMMPEEKFIDYVFPLLRYHSRWDSLTTADVRYLFERPQQFHNGYYMRVDVKPATTFPEGKKLPDYHFGAKAYKYLDKITQLCQENDIELVLNKAPVLYPYWYPEWDQQMVEYAREHGLRYYNFLQTTDTIGIDFSTDTYDAGLHLNLSGVEKLSRYFGSILRDQLGVIDHRSDPALAAIYEGKAAFYDAMKQQQLEEIAEYGQVLGYGPPR